MQLKEKLTDTHNNQTVKYQRRKKILRAAKIRNTSQTKGPQYACQWISLKKYISDQKSGNKLDSKC